MDYHLVASYEATYGGQLIVTGQNNTTGENGVALVELSEVAAALIKSGVKVPLVFNVTQAVTVQG